MLRHLTDVGRFILVYGELLPLSRLFTQSVKTTLLVSHLEYIWIYHLDGMSVDPTYHTG